MAFCLHGIHKSANSILAVFCREKFGKMRFVDLKKKLYISNLIKPATTQEKYNRADSAIFL